jgi:hypothetical protein
MFELIWMFQVFGRAGANRSALLGGAPVPDAAPRRRTALHARRDAAAV